MCRQPGTAEHPLANVAEVLYLGRNGSGIDLANRLSNKGLPARLHIQTISPEIQAIVVPPDLKVVVASEV